VRVRRATHGGHAWLEVVLEQDERAHKAEGAMNGGGLFGAPEHVFVRYESLRMDLVGVRTMAL